MTTYAQRIATLSGEDAPETKARYRVVIGDDVAIFMAYDAPHAEQLARRQWRAEHDVASNAEIPEAVARWLPKASEPTGGESTLRRIASAAEAHDAGNFFWKNTAIGEGYIIVGALDTAITNAPRRVYA